jgi:hypothetical protein
MQELEESVNKWCPKLPPNCRWELTCYRSRNPVFQGKLYHKDKVIATIKTNYPNIIQDAKEHPAFKQYRLNNMLESELKK